MASEGPRQGALFEIAVDDDDGCVWVLKDGQAMNLGPVDAVSELLAEWLAQRDYGEL